jgi:hypothetical protein
MPSPRIAAWQKHDFLMHKSATADRPVALAQAAQAVLGPPVTKTPARQG